MLSFPFQLRFLLARCQAVLSQVLGIVYLTLEGGAHASASQDQCSNVNTMLWQSTESEYSFPYMLFLQVYLQILKLLVFTSNLPACERNARQRNQARVQQYTGEMSRLRRASSIGAYRVTDMPARRRTGEVSSDAL